LQHGQKRSLPPARIVLAPGERGVCLIIAPDQRQAAITLSYAEAAFQQSPMLQQLITNKTVDTLELGNIAIEVRAASFRRLRGPTYVALQCTCISTN
jgi:hypothetical protein